MQTHGDLHDKRNENSSLRLADVSLVTKMETQILIIRSVYSAYDYYQTPAHLLQQVVVDVTTHGVALEVKIDVHVFTEAAGVVVPVRLGVAERLQDDVRADQDVLNSKQTNTMRDGMEIIYDDLLRTGVFAHLSTSLWPLALVTADIYLMMYFEASVLPAPLSPAVQSKLVNERSVIKTGQTSYALMDEEYDSDDKIGRAHV